MLTASDFLYYGDSILKRAKAEVTLGDRDFRALFGVGANICSIIWNSCCFSTTTKPKHLLWTLMFLKVYATEPVLVTIAGSTTRKTFRTWVWTVIDEIAAQVPSLVSAPENEPVVSLL
jgi:hypothetical protein